MDFFFILKKIINIRVLNVLFFFLKRENSLLGYLIYIVFLGDFIFKDILGRECKVGII